MASDLPEEILVEILSRLPTKIVGKFRCLSKYWCTYLSTTQFVNLHLKTYCKTRQENIILITMNSLKIIPSPLKNYSVSKQIDLSTNGNTFWKFFRGSCNGLVLLQNTEHDMFLVNPITLQCLNIPDINYDSKEYSYELLGFGHDPSSDDYKVIKLSWSDENVPIEFIDVYSVRRGSWKRVVVYSPHVRPPLDWTPCMAFVNGALHWLTRTSGLGLHYLIVAFDLEHEIFREIPIPIYFDFSRYWKSEVSVLGGCLCVKADYSIVWVMKEYGVVDSLIRIPINSFISYLDIATTVTPLCFVSDDEFFCRGFANECFVYNVKDKRLKRVCVGEISCDPGTNVGAFVDSLVSLEKYVSSTHI